MRDARAFAGSGATFGFAFPEDADPVPDPACAVKTPWRQSDVRRAIAAAEHAGLGHYRVEIGSDGTITIVVGADGS